MELDLKWNMYKKFSVILILSYDLQVIFTFVCLYLYFFLNLILAFPRLCLIH